MGKCFNSVVVNAPIDQVWKYLRDFHNMSWAAGVITSCESVGETAGDQVGAQRILNGAFHETLRSRDDSAYCLSYTIDEGPEPVSSETVKNYVGTIQLHSVTDTNQTFCTWESTYESDSDDLVAGFCNPIYAAMLECLKRSLSKSL